MRKLSKEDVRELQMQILDDVHEFCQKNGLRYSLIGGSMLGAVRHKGFIPWDDDMDIMMPRPDYETFMRTYVPSVEYHEIADSRTDKNYISGFAKIYDTRTVTDSVNIIDNKSVYIDIFPIDGTPGEKEIDEYCSEIRIVMEDLRKSGKYYLYADSILRKITFFLKYLIKRSTVSSTKCLQAKLAKILSQHEFDSSDYVGNLVGRWGKKECMPKRIYTELEPVQFENRQYIGIKNADEYLTHMYGDWRKLPPENQRVGDHLFEIYMKSE